MTDNRIMLNGPMRLAVFASGGGSNMQAIIDAALSGELDAEITLCVCNRTGAGVLDRAARHRIPAAVLSPSHFPDEATYTEKLMGILEGHGINFIALAGYLKKIPTELVRAYAGRMLNIHPSLLPAFGGPGFYGRRVHEAALERGVRWTGVTVHLVDETYDTGPIVLQEPVPVLPDDTPQTLADRVLKVEHQLYPRALQLFAAGRISLEGHHVRILDE